MPDTLLDLIRNIINDNNIITPEVLMKLLDSSVERAHSCWNSNGGQERLENPDAYVTE